MQEDFFFAHLPLIPLAEIARALSGAWDEEQLRRGYRCWQLDFYQRASLVYQSQYQRHSDMLQSEFRQMAGLDPDEWISSKGDPLEWDWQRFAGENGLWAHREHMAVYLASYGVDEDAWKPARIGSLFAELAFTEVIRAIWPLWFKYATRTDEAEQLRRLPYQEYLKTPYWRRVRVAMLIASQARCSGDLCRDVGEPWYGSESDLHVHHLHYRNRGEEQLDNLILLCFRCHRRAHRGQTSLTGADALSATL